MEHQFASRMGTLKESFIREILKVTEQPNVISFAGGLPNPDVFPVQEMAEASNKVLLSDGASALQYSTTAGYRPLREYIAERYRIKFDLRIDPDEILITNGSQQGIELVGKIFLDRGDQMVIERPGYLGAIQAFSLFEPEFLPVAMDEEGIKSGELEETLKNNQAKLFYSVPNFQNPSGITYSEERRREVSEILKKYSVLLVEDNPYGELRFTGEEKPLMKSYLNDQCVLLGSFSKTSVPGIRLGWICANAEIMEKITVAKQASDLHSNFFAQRVIYQYLLDNDIDRHIGKIRALYGKQGALMVSMIEKWFPKSVAYTRPEGGMFIWVTLPEGISSLELFEVAIKKDVAFVPGAPFYVDDGGRDTFRLNFSNSNEEKIEEGIKRLGDAIRELLESGGKRA